MNKKFAITPILAALLLVGCGDEPTGTPVDLNPDDPANPSTGTPGDKTDADLYIFHSTEETNAAFEYWMEWGSGSTHKPISDATYTEVIEITAGTGWGGDPSSALIWGNPEGVTIDASAVNTARFKVKGSGVDLIEVHVQSTNAEDKQTYSISEGTDLGNGWVQMEVAIPSYSNMTAFGFVFPNTTTVYLADVYLTQSEQAPGSGTDADEFVLISGSSSDTDIEFNETTVSDWSTSSVLDGNISHNGMNAWKVAKGEGDNNWGAVLAFTNGINDDLSDFNSLDLTLATDGGFSDYKVVLASNGVSSELTLPVDDANTDKWQNIEMNLDDFNLDMSQVDYVALFAIDGTVGQSAFYASDFKFIKDTVREINPSRQGDFVFKHTSKESDLIVDDDNWSDLGNVMFGEWSTGTSISEETYLGKSAWVLTSADGWGAVLALQGDLSQGDNGGIDNYDVDLSKYTHIAMKVASDGDAFTKYALTIVSKDTEGESSKEIAFALDDPSQWNEIIIDLDKFGLDLANVNQIAVFGVTGGEADQKLYVTDFYAYDTGYHPAADTKEYGDEFVIISSTSTDYDLSFDDTAFINEGNATFNDWSTGTQTEIGEAYLGKNAWSMTKGSGWGAVLAITGDIFGEILPFDFDTTDYHYLNVSVAVVGSFEAVEMKVINKQGVEVGFPLANLSSEWSAFKFDLNEFPMDIETINHIAIYGTDGDAGDVLYVTDFTFSKN